MSYHGIGLGLGGAPSLRFGPHVPGNPKLLDQFGGAAAAFSLRELSTAFVGQDIVRVRRSSDDTEQDFTATGVTGGALTTFTGAENLVQYSEQFDNAYWARNNLNVSGTPAWVNVAEAPDGTMTAEKLIPDDTLTAHQFFRSNFAHSNSTFFTASCYVKAAGRDYILIRLIARNAGAAVENIDARVDLTDGTVAAVQSASYFTEVSAAIVDVGNGWYRAFITGKTAATGADSLDFFLRATTSTWGAFTGNNTDGYFVWGAQVSRGAAAAYNRTTTGIGGDGFVVTWYDQSGNTRNITQPTAGEQPKLVDAGSLIADSDGDPVVSFAASQVNLIRAAGIGLLGSSASWTFAVGLSLYAVPTGGSSQYSFVGRYGGFTANRVIDCRITGANSLSILTSDGTSEGSMPSTAIASWAINTPYHVVWQKAGTVGKAYLDGGNETTGTGTLVATLNASSTSPFTVGRSNETFGQINAAIKNLIVWPKALTLSEVNGVYTQQQ